MAGIRTRSRTAKGKPQRYFLSKQQAGKCISWLNTNPQHFFHVFPMHLGGARYWESNVTCLRKQCITLLSPWAVIGYPSRQAGIHLALSGLPVMSRKRHFLRKPHNRSFIDQACSVKMTGYWPRSVVFFASLWTSTPLPSINTHKK